MLSWLDRDLLLRLNTFMVDNWLVSAMFANIAENPLIRGFPIFFPLVMLWFFDDCNKRRGRMVIGLLAACLAVNISLLSQHYISVHGRPFLDQTLPINIYDRKGVEVWDRVSSSFPSDTATLYFSIATIIFLGRPLLGSVAMLWAVIASGLARVALGLHYPSDIVGAFALGPGCVYLITKIKYLDILAERVLDIFQSRTYIINSMFVIFVAEAYSLFPGLHGILDILKRASERLMNSS